MATPATPEQTDRDQDKSLLDSSPLNQNEVAQAISMAKQLHVYKPGIDFVPGAKVEVQDARDQKWYLCKVVEVDWGELDILVHYERWSNRFDEWLKMDSTRIRAVPPGKSRDGPHLDLCIGDKVTAQWAIDKKSYPATVKCILSDDQYEVLFYDGVTRILKSSFITKGDTDVNHPVNDWSMPSDMSSAGSTQTKQRDSMGIQKNIFDVEILVQKRERKRKPEVVELFQSIKKKRKVGDDSEASTSHHEDPGNMETNPSADSLQQEEEPDVNWSVEGGRVILNMPIATMDGWTRCCARRTSSVKKWDLYYVSPTGRKIRLRSDLQKYFEECGENYNIDDFDFSMKPMKAMMEEYEFKLLEVPLKKKVTLKNKEDFQKEVIDMSSKKKVKEQSAAPSKVKVQIPVVKQEVQQPVPHGKGKKRSTQLPKQTFLAPNEFVVQMEHNEHRCPKPTCQKGFRKLSFLQMHMKHYHPEMKKRGKVPNVSDLAYARTLNDSLEAKSPAIIEQPLVKPDWNTKKGKISSKTESKISGSGHGKRISQSKQEELSPAPFSNLVEEAHSENEHSEGGAIVHIEDVSEVKPQIKINERHGKTGKRTKSECSVLDYEDEFAEPVLDVKDSPEIINCGCGSTVEEGLMLQCDVCLCWQHSACYSIITNEQIPERYTCWLCENPRLQRSSSKFRHHQDWLKEGKLPRFASSMEDVENAKMEKHVQLGHQLSASVLQMSEILHGLRMKLHIAKEKDHPKLVMWHKKWGTVSDTSNREVSDISAAEHVAAAKGFLEFVTNAYPTNEAMVQLNVGEQISLGDRVNLEQQQINLNGQGLFVAVSTIGDKCVAVEPKVDDAKDVDLIPWSEMPFMRSEFKEQIWPVAHRDHVERAEESISGHTETSVQQEMDEVMDVCVQQEIESTKIADISRVSGNLIGQRDEIREHVDTVLNVSLSCKKPSSSESDADSAHLHVSNFDDDHQAVITDDQNAIIVDTQPDISDNLSAIADCHHPANSDYKPVITDINLRVADSKPTLVVDKNLSLMSEKCRKTDSAQSVVDENISVTDKKQCAIFDSHTVINDDMQSAIADESNGKCVSDNESPFANTEDDDFQLSSLNCNTEMEEEGGSDLADMFASGTSELDQLQLVSQDVAQFSANSLAQFSTQHSGFERVESHRPISFPEAERIEPAKCRLNLLKHISEVQDKVSKHYDEIESQLKALETEMGLSSDTDDDDQANQGRSLVQLLLNDASIVNKISQFTS